VLLILHSAVTTLVDLQPFEPNLLLPIVIFLGVSPAVHIVRGAATAFALGYLLDLSCGHPMSLHTVVMVATFFLARGAGLRLFLRGPLFQIILTFVVSVLAGGAVLALRTLFGPVMPFPTATVASTAMALAAPALVTALCAPVVFTVVQRLESFVVRGREEPAGGSAP
jgi:rod shape-determining protein MreD